MKKTTFHCLCSFQRYQKISIFSKRYRKSQRNQSQLQMNTTNTYSSSGPQTRVKLSSLWCREFVSRSNFCSILSLFSSYTTSNKLLSINFWPQIITVYSCISNRAEFKDLLKDDNFNGYFKLFVGMAWKTANERENQINLTKKAFKILYIDYNEEKQIIEDSNSVKIIEFITKFCSIINSEGKPIQSTSVDVILSTLHRIYSYTKIATVEKFLPLRDYLIKVVSTYQTDERSQFLVCQVLSDVLRLSPVLLKTIFASIFSKDENLSSHAILEIANAYQFHDDFGDIYEDGHSTIFATTILHINNEIVKPRQAVFKLMRLMLKRKNDIFTITAPLDLMKPLTSPNPSASIRRIRVDCDQAADHRSECLVTNILNDRRQRAVPIAVFSRIHESSYCFE